MTRVGLMVVVRNEQDLIAEWLGVHAAAGCGPLLVYDNGSTDRTLEIVQAAAREIDVSWLRWDDETPLFQTRAYDDAVARFGQDLDWLGFLDCDEILVAPSTAPIPAVMDSLAGAEAVAVNWRLYGSSGREHATTALVTESYLRRATDAFGANKHVKTLVRPAAFRGAVNPHMVAVEGRYLRPDGGDVPWMRDGVTTDAGQPTPLRVNHYFVRSRQDWRRKLARGYRDLERRESDFDFYDRNEVLDPCAAPLGALARTRFAFLADRPPPQTEPS